MIYLILAIVNVIYGALLLSTLSADTAGFFLVLIIGLVLTIMGLVGVILWIRMVTNTNADASDNHVTIKSWFSLAKSFDIVLVVGLLFKAFILQPFIVEGSSMEPNFHDKEIMLVDKISYHLREPQRGDIVIFEAPKNPEDDYIKRIIALPGETVQIAKGKVFINGVILSEDYLPSGQITNNETSSVLFSQTLKTNEYFTLGDNRDNSYDSRAWGVLPKANIVGRAWWNIYPFSYFGLVKHVSFIMEENQTLQNYLTTTSDLADKFNYALQTESKFLNERIISI